MRDKILFAEVFDQENDELAVVAEAVSQRSLDVRPFSMEVRS